MKWKVMLVLIVAVGCMSTDLAADDGGHRIRLILDTDANNELDDQHAIAYMLFNGDVFEVEGITVNRTRSGGGIDKHVEEAERIVRLCGLHEQVKVYKGASGNYDTILPHIVEPEFDGSEAVDFIIDRANVDDPRMLVVLGIGKLTNIALALKKDPSIANRIRVVWIGSDYPDEYDVENDLPAINPILETEAVFEVIMSPRWRPLTPEVGTGGRVLAHYRGRNGKFSGTDDVTARLEDIQRIMPGKGPSIATPVAGRHGGEFSNFGDYSVELFEKSPGSPTERPLLGVAAVALVKNHGWGERVVIVPPMFVDGMWVNLRGFIRDVRNPRRIIVWENLDEEGILQDFYDRMDEPVLTSQRLTPTQAPTPGPGYYIDSVSGDDNNSGTGVDCPWKSLAKVSSMTFQPGDNIYFKRGSSWSGCVTINGDGTASRPITVSAYGTGHAPSFTNPDREDQNGNALRVRGDYQIIENLYFHHCASAWDRSDFDQVWAVGALHVSLGNDHVIIRDNEFAFNAKAIHSYSEHSLITRNYIHHANPNQSYGYLTYRWGQGWGPLGIHMGIGNQEVSYNTITGLYRQKDKYSGDGGAMEIDDGRNHKDNFYIHHNYTEHNMGFLEVSWQFDSAKRKTSNIRIENNVSRDYEQFLYMFASGENNSIKNNTIIRTDEIGVDVSTVFYIYFPAFTISNNIIVTNNDMRDPVFHWESDDGIQQTVHMNNCYWDVDDGDVQLGLPWGPGEIAANPLFVDFDGGDYRLLPGSPCAGWGAF